MVRVDESAADIRDMNRRLQRMLEETLSKNLLLQKVTFTLLTYSYFCIYPRRLPKPFFFHSLLAFRIPFRLLYLGVIFFHSGTGTSNS